MKPVKGFTDYHSVCKLVAMKLSEFLNKKFLEWQVQEGERKTIEQFAALFGATQPLMSMWMNGDRKPGPEGRRKLMELYGDQVAEVLGEDPRLFFINEHWNDASEELQRAIHDLLQKGISKNDVQRVSKRGKKTVNK